MKHLLFAVSLFAAILLAWPFSLEAQKAPLPTKILEAKTVFLLGNSGHEGHIDGAYDALDNGAAGKLLTIKARLML